MSRLPRANADALLRTLRTSPVFGGGKPEILMALAEQATPLAYPAGAFLCRQGEPAAHVFVLTKGEVEVKVRAENGAEKLVARLAAPNVFGEMGVVTGEPRTASVIAASEVECYRLDKEAFQRVLKQRPQIAESVSNVMARRRVELAAVREGLDAAQHKLRMREEKSRILDSLQTFFGMDDEKAS